MSDEDIVQELDAIKQVVEALQPLTPEGRDRVINYVFQTLGISMNVTTTPPTPPPPVVGEAPPEIPLPPQIHGQATKVISDIRSFKEQKQPRTANEMAAVLAYYMAELAPHDSQKSEINAADVNKYFKQAGFPLPAAARFTLQNAKNAGYLDSGSERGGYILNPVGHNLVAHTLPTSEANSSTGTPKPRRKKTAKPKPKKKSTGKKKPVKKKSTRK